MENIIILIYISFCIALIYPIRKYSNDTSILKSLSIIDILGTYHVYTTTFILIFIALGYFDQLTSIYGLGTIISTLLVILNFIISFIYIQYHTKKVTKITNNEDYSGVSMCLVNAFFFITYPIIFIYLFYKRKRTT